MCMHRGTSVSNAQPGGGTGGCSLRRAARTLSQHVLNIDIKVTSIDAADELELRGSIHAELQRLVQLLHKSLGSEREKRNE